MSSPPSPFAVSDPPPESAWLQGPALFEVDWGNEQDLKTLRTEQWGLLSFLRREEFAEYLEMDSYSWELASLYGRIAFAGVLLVAVIVFAFTSGPVFIAIAVLALLCLVPAGLARPHAAAARERMLRRELWPVALVRADPHREFDNVFFVSVLVGGPLTEPQALADLVEKARQLERDLVAGEAPPEVIALQEAGDERCNEQVPYGDSLRFATFYAGYSGGRVSRLAFALVDPLSLDEGSIQHFPDDLWGPGVASRFDFFPWQVEA